MNAFFLKLITSSSLKFGGLSIWPLMILTMDGKTLGLDSDIEKSNSYESFSKKIFIGSLIQDLKQI